MLSGSAGRQNLSNKIEYIGVYLTVNHKTGRWVTGFAAGLTLVVLLSPAVPHPKVTPQRVQGVNNIAWPFPNKDLVIPGLVVTNGAYPMMTR